MRVEKVRLDKMREAYGSIKAPEDINLSLYQGELSCVTGLNGSDESVLTDTISGKMPKDGERTHVDGRSVVFTSTRQVQTAGVFCMRYKVSVINGTSMEKNLYLIRRQDCLLFPARQEVLRMREMLKSLEIECRLQAPIASLSLMERHTIEICRTCYAGMKVLILGGIARSYTLRGAGYMKRLVIWFGERGIFISWIGIRPEIMLGAASRLAVLRERRSAAVLYWEEFGRQMIDRIITGENRKTGRGIARSQAEPGGWAVLLSVRKVRARELRDVSFHVCPGEVANLVHPEDTYYRKIVRLLNGGSEVESRSARPAEHQVELAEGRKNMVRRGFRYIEDCKKNLFLKLDMAENLTIAGLKYFAPRVGMREKLEQTVTCDYLTLLDIREGDLRRPIRTLSYRCQLNVALYRWIIAKARLIVINNLFSGTDILMRNSVRGFLGFVKSRGIGVVYCFPGERELASVCDRFHELAERKVFCR